MKTRQQSLHDERGQSRVGKEAHAEKADDVGVTEGAHQSTFLHELARRLGNLSLKNGIDGFCGGVDGNGHLVDFAVGSTAKPSSSELYVRENEGSQTRVVAEKSFSHHLRESCARAAAGVIT